MIDPVQSRCHEGSPVGERSLRWEKFVENVRFEPGVKEWRMMRGVMIIEINVKKTVVYTLVKGALHIENCKNYKKVFSHQHIA